ncbi:MAG: alpha-L-arabinofuranosidase C-terminal domain-containing protein [Verrucomicrobiota bacterium]|jgi:alpha-N-arabinofuranosidase
MNRIKWPTNERQFLAVLAFVCACAGVLSSPLNAETADVSPVLRIDASRVTAKASPTLYGLMTEEINYSYEGGLYGELIRNRSFKASTNEARFWTALGSGAITLDASTPLNEALNVSLKLDAAGASQSAPAGIANGGYWGIPVRPKTTYHASFYARAANGFTGPLRVAIVSTNWTTTVASAEVSGLTGDWKKYEVTLTTKRVTPSKDNIFTITTSAPGLVWFQQVSLFPPTFKGRANGNRPDIMQLLGDMNPKFLRFPGGNYLEGNTIETRFNWKKTVGDIAERPGHRNDGWGYWSTDGLGLLEFLEWCEDLEMQPVLAIYAGYSMRQRHVAPGDDLQPYVQEGLDEIEYVTGDASTHWGGQRAKDGHPAPFGLNYVEIGNEDFFDRSGSYEERFAQFYDAIKAKYPSLQVIATDKVKSRQPDLVDEHYYRTQEEMEAHAHDYDKYARTNHTKIFCGEWATRIGSPTPNMAGALGDAAWMTGMERNSDIVLMSCYAPLFVNVSPGAMQWKTDLIGYDAMTSYGSPAYYAQKMFSTHHGDEVLATSAQNIPTYQWQPPTRRRNGDEQPRPAAQDVPTLFFDATRESQSGTIYLKVVNRRDVAQPVEIEISGVSKVSKKGKSISLKAEKPTDTNSIKEPKKIVPRIERARGLGANFTRIFPPFSITVLELNAK